MWPQFFHFQSGKPSKLQKTDTKRRKKGTKVVCMFTLAVRARMHSTSKRAHYFCAFFPTFLCQFFEILKPFLTENEKTEATLKIGIWVPLIKKKCSDQSNLWGKVVYGYKDQHEILFQIFRSKFSRRRSFLCSAIFTF